MKLSLCLNSATGSLSRTEAMDLAKKHGYSAVEFWEGKDFDLGAYKNKLSENGLTVACMGGGGGELVNPEARSAYLENVKVCLENAKTLGAKGMIATTGQALDTLSREVQRESVVEGLKGAAKIIAGSGIKIYLEPLNILVNHKGYFLYTSQEAFDIVREVGSEDVKVLFDIYHQQITEGNLIANITANIDLIGHFHAAGNPGRGEPYLGEINYSEVFAAADAAGYKGYCGLEYWPKGDMEESLKRCIELYEQ